MFTARVLQLYTNHFYDILIIMYEVTNKNVHSKSITIIYKSFL